ncbi:MAG TPA: hypothetical protein VHF69_05215 [Candidatus Synoicihabitans sp.]|nr:hypothetical protein [Candidatus Synoicihabitans sp.]
MEILLKILVALIWAAALVGLAFVFDKKIARLLDARWQLVARAFLYALAFTPTAYHHAPNTIVAPLHLSTICGNLFYAYDYTVGMFAYGVVVPIACSWALLTIIFLFRKTPQLA